MANLRLIDIKARSSTSIRAKFTDELDTLINTSNVTIVSNLPSIPDPEVRRITIRGDLLDITCQPLTPQAAYFITFQRSSSADFKSLNGTSFLLEDGKTNVPLLIGPEDPEDSIRQFLVNFLNDQGIYNLDSRTLIRDVVNAQSSTLSKGLHDIRQLKNENYIEDVIIDEPKIRRGGPYDRLNEESAYEVIRVGRRPGQSTSSSSISFSDFPNTPITLQAVSITNESLVAGAGAGTFDRTTLTVAKFPVTKLTSLIIRRGGGGQDVYDISAFGYRLNNARYDPNLASTLLTLENNQIGLSRRSLELGFNPPAAGDTVLVSYEYKALGRIIEEETVAITQVLDATREQVPAIIKDFTLDHAPIVNSNDEIISSGGVTFLDPNSNPPFTKAHPAFVNELPFRFSGVPQNPGDYSVDYETGRVFVYGESDNDGTGFFPPVATYKYRNSFVSDLDYTYDPTSYEVVSSPLRDLATQEAKISFDFEESLVPGIDFVAQVHQESLNERVENRINSTNSISVQNTPITDVFRVFNETTGEIYPVTRFTNNTIIFNSSTPPRIRSLERERAFFTDVLTELLIVDEETTNTLGVRVLTILLRNNRIMASTEDVIGTSYNSSATFSRTDIFDIELYFDGQIQTVTQNINRLTAGRYQIDYENGIVYVGVELDQSLDIGTINYKKGVIDPAKSHLISVEEIYHSISAITGISKKIDYTSIGDSEITPSTFDRADERFLNGDTTLPYINSISTIEVTDDIKNVRSVYDAYDLNNNEDPTNFAEGATTSANIITLSPGGVEKQEVSSVSAGFIVSLSFIAPEIEIASVESVVRTSDGYDLYDELATISGYDIILSGIGSPVVGEEVIVTYNVRLTGGATPIVDYNRGDYFIDYTYLADEILVSYEYGDNVLDFRDSNTLDQGDEYYVTYRVGALRRALLKNFGSLIDIPVLSSFDVDLPRVRYRDAIRGALQSFTKGPTIPAIEQLVSSITRIDPDIVEAVFENWSLGVSYLNPNAIDWTEGIQLLAGKFDRGALVENPGESISFPVSSNLRIEEGTLETWVIPEWDGLDNDATLTFEIYKDGYSISASEIFIGASSYNPTLDLQNKFQVDRFGTPSAVGLPSAVFTSTGVFIFYNEDTKRWELLAKDSVTDNHVYSGKVISSGEVYDVKVKPGLGEINDIRRSGLSTIEFEFNLDGYDALSPDGYNDGYNVVDGYVPGDGYVAGFSYDGITFMADDEHYIFDFGASETENRFSLYKDGRGYLNFRIFDRGGPRPNRKNQYKVSADISDWVAGQKHHVAVTWRINTVERRDEMHIFVDGFEVPNIIRYGGRPTVALTNRFRTVVPEIIAGTVPLRAITAADLSTTAGSTLVTSDSINFDDEGIVPGNTIRILESGFDVYTIVTVSDNSLVLSLPMPTTLNDARFSVNEFEAIVASDVDLFKNIAVSIISAGDETEIPGLRAEIPGYAISKNGLNQNVFTLYGNANAGDQIAIKTLGLNHRRARARQYVWGNSSSIIRTQLPPPINLNEVEIYPVILPLLSIGPSNAALIAGNFLKAGILAETQPSSPTEGRTLAVRMTGSNVDFGTAATVTIYGTTESGAPSEVISFSIAGTKNTTERFRTITSIDIEAMPLVENRNTVAVEIREAFPITNSEGNSIYPVIRYSFKTKVGSELEGDGVSAVVSDNSTFFPSFVEGQLLVITSPAGAAGLYTIEDRIDNNTIRLDSAPPIAFTSGDYEIYNTSLGRSGFQNGFFTFEQAGAATTPWLLQQGYYDFDYSTYLEIPFDPISNQQAHIGSDLNKNKQARAIIDEFRILSRQLTDVRVGETIGAKEEAITKDFQAIRPFTKNSDTLLLLHFDEFPLTNDVDFWVTADKSFIQSSDGVNDNFDKSLVITNKPLSFENKGLLNTLNTGSIEFWVSPRFDTFNDPNFRFYFDAPSAVVEEVTSITNGTVKVSGSVSNVQSVRLVTDVENTGTDYFAGGSIENDARTLSLGQALPYQQTPVKVAYVPLGLFGDRVSIFKDPDGFITFNVRAGGTDFQIKQSIFWERDSWHRIKASYSLNNPNGQDQIRLFVDGQEGSTAIVFGSGLIFGTGAIFGQASTLETNTIIDDMNFRDPVNQIYIGADFLGGNIAQARIDNLRLSNIVRSPTIVSGEPRDINYSSNLGIVFPVIEDAGTTLLLDFNTIKFRTDDLTHLIDEAFGIFNFTLNIIDSFDIVLSSAKVQQILEDLIFALKPGHSKAKLNYIQ